MFLMPWCPFKHTPLAYIGVLVWNFAELFGVKLKQPQFWFELAMGLRDKRM